VPANAHNPPTAVLPLKVFFSVRVRVRFRVRMKVTGKARQKVRVKVRGRMGVRCSSS
jgi:hypothetical protein